MLKQITRSFFSRPVTVNGPSAGGDALQQLAGKVDALAHKRLGRSLSIRAIDAGSCNGCELEIHALNNPVYDLERFGIRFVASPRHADVLLVTGPVSLNMQEALLRTIAATPEPRWVVAAGDCACTGGLFAGSYACAGALESVVPVDLRIPGCPPTPLQLLEGLLAVLEASAGRIAAAGKPGNAGVPPASARSAET